MSRTCWAGLVCPALLLLLVQVAALIVTSQEYLSDWSARSDTPDQLPPKQTFWDHPVIASDRALVQSCLDSPFQLVSFRPLPPVIAEIGCLRCRLHPAAPNSTTRQSGLQSVYVLGWTCVFRTFADAAGRSKLAVCTASSPNRPLIKRPDITY